MSSCLKLSGQLDLSGTSVGCASAPVTGELHVSGTLTANADGRFTDGTITSGDAQLTLAPACLTLSGTTTSCERLSGALKDALGYTSLTCTAAPTGGGCTCSASIQQMGAPGLVAFEPATSGRYKTAGTVVTLAVGEGDTQYPYCVSGGQLSLTPQSTNGTLTGTIVLQKNESSGDGGMGDGGMTGGSDAATGGVGGAGGTGGAGGGGGAADGGVMPRTDAGAGGSMSMPPPGTPPCDLYNTGKTPCVAAYGTVRLLSSTYTGPLYQLRKGGTKTGTGGTTMDIGTVGGFADVAAHEAFCSNETCTFAKLYDQSGKANHLVVAPKGCYMGTAMEDDYESNAMKRAVMVNGHKIDALYMEKHEGYRNNKTTGMPTGSQPQGIYEVVDGNASGPIAASTSEMRRPTIATAAPGS